VASPHSNILLNRKSSANPKTLIELIKTAVNIHKISSKDFRLRLRLMAIIMAINLNHLRTRVAQNL
jgi:hypothetical protein